MSARGRDANIPSAMARDGRDISDGQWLVADSRREINNKETWQPSLSLFLRCLVVQNSSLGFAASHSVKPGSGADKTFCDLGNVQRRVQRARRAGKILGRTRFDFRLHFRPAFDQQFADLPARQVFPRRRRDKSRRNFSPPVPRPPARFRPPESANEIRP